jgi:hypothetical protein
MKIRTVEVEVLHYDWTDRQTDKHREGKCYFQNFVRVQKRNSQIYTINTHRCYCHIDLLNIFWNCGNNTWAYELCHNAYVHTLQVSVLLTVYPIQLFKQMSQISHNRAYLWKNDFGYTELCSMMCVCVCVPTTKQENVVLEQGLGEIFCMMREGISGGWKTAQWGPAWFVLGSEWWWVVNWKRVGQMGQEKFTGGIKNTYKFSVWNPERKRQFGRSRPRWNVKIIVMNCTEKITIPGAFRLYEVNWTSHPSYYT